MALIGVLLYLSVQGLKSRIVENTTLEPVKVAIVAPGEQEHLELATKLIGSMDSVQSICNIVFLTEKKAIQQMEQGKIAAILLLSDDFYNDVNTGTNTPVTIILEPSLSLSTLVFQNLISDGVSLIQTTEAGIYAMSDVGLRYEMKISINEMEDLLTKVYVENAMKRSNLFQEKIVSPMGELNLDEYYMSALLSIFLFLTGACFTFLYRKDDTSVELRLGAYGIHKRETMVAKTMIMTLFLFLTSLLLSFLASKLPLGKWIQIREISGSTILGLFLIAVSMSCFFNMVYSTGRGKAHGGMVILLMGLFMIVLCGWIYPIVYLPSVMQPLGEVMPLSIWKEGIEGVWFQKFTAQMFFWQLLYAGICCGISEVISWKN